ncbi:cyclic nucleotide-binding domain-containing protein [Clostridium tetani]|uniref:cyclic nucleotide-binding domain-containing protein n=1 Tax=Clostridium tetani TaxID=1513 RepID=UPI0003C0C707|nr:cyclic nucleotide-binding domain-containing protein [Clostridium tetani]CDI50074.1 catabolite gene activator [Clostridium tetani 12124569]
MFFDNEIPLIIFESGTKRTFLKNDNIYKINGSATHCYFILSGTAKIYIDHKNGRRSILDFVGRNDWVGEISLFCYESDIKENRVLQDVECLEFDMNELRKLCKENGKVSFYFASYISNKLLTRSYRMSESLNYSLDRRLAAFILQYQQNGIYSIPHTDVSEYMNVSYRHVLYVIKQFCELGILKKENGKEYIISDIEKLKELQEK